MDMKQKKAQLLERIQTDVIEDTFGPNPCTSLTFTNDEGDSFGVPCDCKRCVHCGPRKKATIEHQLQQGMGTHAYIRDYVSKIDLDRDLERVRKACQRASEPLLYQVVGDSTLGWLVCSTHPMVDGDRKAIIEQWTRRILDRYHHAVQRIRRSYALGRVSLVRRKKTSVTGNSGQPSPWRVKTYNSEAMRATEDLHWRDVLAEIEWREGVLHKYLPPDLTLPIPI